MPISLNTHYKQFQWPCLKKTQLYRTKDKREVSGDFGEYRAVGMDTRCLSIRDQHHVIAEFKANSVRAPAAIAGAEY